MRTNKIYAVIPALNEDERIKDVIDKTKKYVNKVVVVDDGSIDNTFETAKKAGAITLKHIVNMGKGAALKTGCDFAIEDGADAIVVLDADAQHDPDEIPKFIKTLEEESLDIVFGCRRSEKTMPLILRFGNWFINQTTKILFGMDMMDTQSGYRAFTADAYKKIRWEASDYSMESEMIANVGKKGLNYKEILIKTIYSDKYKGTTIIDGIKIVMNMFWSPTLMIYKTSTE